MKAWFLACIIAIGGVTGCTVAPHRVESQTASYDGNRLDSGIRGWLPTGELQISEHARSKYNELIKVYGRDYKPTIWLDYGLRLLPDGTYAMSREGAVKFDEMAKWQRAGFAPLNP